MRRLLFIALFLFLLASCGNKGRNGASLPSLTEEEMVSILSDMQIIEADMNFRKSNQQDISGLPQLYYDQLFEHYGITDSVFSENMRYYTTHPDVLERMMDSVMQRLTKVQSESRGDDSQ